MDGVDIPVKDLEPIGPGVFRVKPSPVLLKWAANQGLILIVPPTKEEYEEWKRIAAEKPDGWHSKILAHPDNQDLFAELI